MNEYEIIEFKNDNIELSVNVSPKEDAVWLTQKQMSILFDTSIDNVSLHIKNIFNDFELDDSVVEESSMTASDGKKYKTKIYNLDMVLAVGYRVKSKNAILFRKWANNILKEYLLKGYVVNEDRTLITNENYFNLINKVDSIDSRLKIIENNEQYYNNEKLIVNGELFDAITYLEGLVSKTKLFILLVDPYVDSKALNILKNTNDNIKINIITSSKSKLSKIDINSFVKQYNRKIDININDDFHDRYLFIDDKVFHLGASINYIGKKISQINEVEDEVIKDYLWERVGL
ncbi:MAG: virulence RhuM family protein [Bacilli bacterium]|nr:virulence RhuM family protein [Bacilli bacterium]